MRCHDQDERVVELRGQIQEALNLGLVQAGLGDGLRLEEAMRARGVPLISKRTLNRYLREATGIPTRPHKISRTNLEVLAEMSGTAEERILELCEELWTYCRNEAEPSGAVSRPGSLPSRWFAIGGIRSTTIDSVTVTEQDAEHLSGTIKREYPQNEKGLRWHFAGTHDGFEAIFVHFWPRDQSNPRSRGIMALQQVDNRPLRYRGNLTRREVRGTRHELISRSHTLYLPETFQRVALLDLDHWLVTPWALVPWLEFLNSRGIVDATECLSLEEQLAGKLRDGQIDRDELADRCGRGYAEVMRGQRVEDIEGEVAVFVSAVKGNPIRRLAERLVRSVMALGVAPIIVTRAPIELAKRCAQLLDVDEIYGLLLGADDDPESRYDGTVMNNAGSTAGRRAVVGSVENAQREIVLTVGTDWQSDDPLCHAAQCRIMVREDDSDPLDPDDLLLQPSSVSWADVNHWLSTRLVRSE